MRRTCMLPYLRCANSASGIRAAQDGRIECPSCAAITVNLIAVAGTSSGISSGANASARARSICRSRCTFAFPRSRIPLISEDNSAANVGRAFYPDISEWSAATRPGQRLRATRISVHVTAGTQLTSRLRKRNRAFFSKKGIQCCECCGYPNSTLDKSRSLRLSCASLRDNSGKGVLRGGPCNIFSCEEGRENFRKFHGKAITEKHLPLLTRYQIDSCIT